MYFKLTNNFNRYNKSDDKYAIISVGEETKTFSLWEYYSKRAINPCKYIMDIAGGVVNAVMVGHEHYPKLPIYLKTDKSYNRSETERWKYLAFGKYSGHHIDDIIVEDINYAKWLLDQFLNSTNNTTLKVKMPKSEKDQFITYIYKLPKNEKSKLYIYVSTLKNDILDRWALYNSDQAEKIAEKSNKKFLGTVGELYEFELMLIDMKQFEGYKVYRLVDSEGNVVVKSGNINSKYITKKGDNDSKKYLRVGDTVKFKSYIGSHEIDKKYKIGEKITHLTGDIQ